MISLKETSFSNSCIRKYLFYLASNFKVATDVPNWIAKDNNCTKVVATSFLTSFDSGKITSEPGSNLGLILD